MLRRRKGFPGGDSEHNLLFNNQYGGRQKENKGLGQISQAEVGGAMKTWNHKGDRIS